MKNIKLLLLSAAVVVFFAGCSVEPQMNAQDSTEPELPLATIEGTDARIATASSGIRKNTYPIVLVGGFGVWGRDEMLGLKYWGGLVDIQEKLKSAGYTTVTSSVGPVSSYWDRACELYAQTKGTVVDYGAAHSAKYGHARFGRDYRGKALVPGWGTTTPKIHLIVHSMGGPTARAMASLLCYGSPEDVAAAAASGVADPNGGNSTLFNGGQHIVSGVMTISSPHDGTTLTKLGVGSTNLESDFIQNFAGAIIGLTGGSLSTAFDFKLDQWGLTKRAGESQASYASRVFSSNSWNLEKSKKDFSSAYDGSVIGAEEFNSWAKDDPQAYYFSWATRASRKALFSSNQIPLVSMNPIWVVPGFGVHLGSYRGTVSSNFSLTTNWLDNDGVVNTISQYGPTKYSNYVRTVSKIQKYTGTPLKGAWNNLGLNDTWDHSDIIGITLTSVTNWYISNAKLLASLQ